MCCISCHMLSHASFIVVDVQLLVSYKYPHNERKRKSQKSEIVFQVQLCIYFLQSCVYCNIFLGHIALKIVMLCVWRSSFYKQHAEEAEMFILWTLSTTKSSATGSSSVVTEQLFLSEKRKHKSSDFHWWQSKYRNLMLTKELLLCIWSIRRIWTLRVGMLQGYNFCLKHFSVFINIYQTYLKM